MKRTFIEKDPETLSLGFSPCPNDTFIFDAMVHHKIDTEGLNFEIMIGDVEELNQKAMNKEFFKITDNDLINNDSIIRVPS